MLKIDSPIFLQNIIMLSRKLFLLFKKSTTFWDNPRISQFISIISFSIEITIKEETAKNGGHLRSGSTVVGTRGGGNVFFKVFYFLYVF